MANDSTSELAQLDSRLDFIGLDKSGLEDLALAEGLINKHL